MSVRFPGDTNRLSIVGRTGSGKTVAGVWHLSRRSFDRMPWIVFDFKHDELLQELPYTDELSLKNRPPRRPGIYAARPHPDDTEDMEQFLTKVWENERTGIYIDEGYMVGNRSRAFRRLLTQGRSKRIPLIVLSQRPLWLDRFVFTESEFFQIFHLQDRRDRATIATFAPVAIEKRLPEYHSFWYDVGRASSVVFAPVPQPEVILEDFEARTRPQRAYL